MPVHRARGNNDGEVAHYEVSDPMLDRERDHVVPRGDPLGARGKDVGGAGMMAIVQRDHVMVIVAAAYHPDEQPYPADPGI